MTHCLPQARDDCQAAADALEAYCDSVIDATAVAPADSELERWSVDAILRERPGPSEYDVLAAYALQIDDCTRAPEFVRLRLVR